MKNRIILITGGARSGKSRYAEQRASALGGRRVYVATAEAKDPEMAQRIAEHKKRRRNEWMTLEEPLELTSALVKRGDAIDCALIDCVTIWLSNLLLYRDGTFAQNKVDELVAALPRLNFHALFVTNEVGSSIVPDNMLARTFRDLAGWANQRLAAAADEVVLMVAGLPMIIKSDR